MAGDLFLLPIHSHGRDLLFLPCPFSPPRTAPALLPARRLSLFRWPRQPAAGSSRRLLRAGGLAAHGPLGAALPLAFVVLL